MNNLKDLDAIKKLDPQNVYDSTLKVAEQMEAAWNQVNALDLPKFENIKNIVFCGMGASSYGALVTKALLGRELEYPSELVTDYHLPEWVNEDTLVVLTSYSGTTEEVLSCAEEALAKNTKILVLTKGGALAEFAKKNNVSAYIFDGVLNPCGVPRYGSGYTVLGLIGLLNKTGVITVEEHEITNAISRLKEKIQNLQDIAITDASLFINKIPVIITAEHLSGNAVIFRNQFNEASKTFSTFYLVPDLNHHLMEGLQFPKNDQLYFLALNSLNYSEKIQRRMELTMDVVKKNKHEVYEFVTSGQTVYDDFMEVLVFGSFLTFYLSILYDQNPAINPWVDYFKNELKK